MDVSLTY